jgi:hypothetical protein
VIALQILCGVCAAALLCLVPMIVGDICRHRRLARMAAKASAQHAGEFLGVTFVREEETRNQARTPYVRVEASAASHPSSPVTWCDGGTEEQRTGAEAVSGGNLPGSGATGLGGAIRAGKREARRCARCLFVRLIRCESLLCEHCDAERETQRRGDAEKGGAA